MKTVSPPNVDAYIASFPPPTQALLIEMRTLIKKAAPDAIEGIGYGMPSYKLHGMLVYFAGYAKHIGFYPGGTVALFADELTGYKTSKGAIQFPLDQPLPSTLIMKIVAFRKQQNLEKEVLKKTAKRTKKS